MHLAWLAHVCLAHALRWQIKVVIFDCMFCSHPVWLLQLRVERRQYFPQSILNRQLLIEMTAAGWIIPLELQHD